MSPTEPTVVDRLVQRLTGIGVRTLYRVHGANAEDVFDAAARHHGIRPVIAKHEFGAGAMADGLARISGGPAAVLTTSGGGALNLVPALGESYDSRVPVLAIIGSAPSTTVGRGGFQDMLDPPDTIDLPAILSGVVGCCRIVDHPADVDAAFDEAAACLNRGMPAALVVPKDVQAAVAPDVLRPRVLTGSAPPTTTGESLAGRPSTAASRPPCRRCGSLERGRQLETRVPVGDGVPGRNEGARHPGHVLAPSVKGARTRQRCRAPSPRIDRTAVLIQE